MINSDLYNRNQVVGDFTSHLSHSVLFQFLGCARDLSICSGPKQGEFIVIESKHAHT